MAMELQEEYSDLIRRNGAIMFVGSKCMLKILKQETSKK